MNVLKVYGLLVLVVDILLQIAWAVTCSSTTHPVVGSLISTFIIEFCLYLSYVSERNNL